ncbi:hypothetical protein AAL_07713 [Moelleriella libera RCEF 2490]|uniref:Uncharacterized protein n=1 Tax=Moelleriella libera RCEF 2490 TaxID=1081109 RepID=A0A167WY63_9HYPO|nr:hypothetical protein AAL_07713 [Moelleriella libera RCEF 2490]
MASRQGFERLRHQTLCDGRGLKARQAFRPPYAVRNAGEWTINPQLQGDEEIEVFVYNVTCAEADALPCRKCQVPVCEECRYYPRAAPPTAYPNRRPHLKSSLELWNIMALCTACDAEAERDVEGKFLNELCDCDRYTRWVCLPCYEAEQRFVEKYFDECTKMEFDWDGLEFDEDEEEAPSKCMTDHQFDRAVRLSARLLLPSHYEQRALSLTMMIL